MKYLHNKNKMSFYYENISGRVNEIFLEKKSTERGFKGMFTFYRSQFST